MKKSVKKFAKVFFVLGLVALVGWWIWKKLLPGGFGSGAGTGGKKYVVPDELVKKMRDGTATAADYLAQKEIGEALAAEAWLWGYNNGDNNAWTGPANTALATYRPGWNGMNNVNNNVLDGEANKKAYIMQVFAKFGGRPGVWKTIPGVS